MQCINVSKITYVTCNAVDAHSFHSILITAPTLPFWSLGTCVRCYITRYFYLQGLTMLSVLFQLSRYVTYPCHFSLINNISYSLILFLPYKLFKWFLIIDSAAWRSRLDWNVAVCTPGSILQPYCCMALQQKIHLWDGIGLHISCHKSWNCAHSSKSVDL